MGSNSGYNRGHQMNIDNQSPDEPVDTACALQDHLLGEGVPAWLADAVVEVACNDDMAYLKTQIERHVPGWVRP